MPDALRARFLTALYRHGRFLELNLSVYFSPNTHLLGEAVALHALGVLFPAFPRAARWAETGGRIVEQQMERQVRDDGSHFEQSAYYHVYALDFFLLYRVMAKPAAAYDAQAGCDGRVPRCAARDVDGTLPLIGDDDGGRLFHPYGERAGFGRATMATCAVLLQRPEWLRGAEYLHEQAAWWLGADALSMAARRRPRARVSRFFSDGGTAVMVSGDVQLVVKAGPFGEGSGGHSHSDVLSLTARAGGREILIDPGTFTYVADPAERNRFRGSGAHNTVRIDGRDQAVPGGPFRWNDKPAVSVRQWATRPDRDYLDASCAYAGFTHRRRVAVFEARHGDRFGYDQRSVGRSPAGAVLASGFGGGRGPLQLQCTGRGGGRVAVARPLQQGTRYRALRHAAGSAAGAHGGSGGSLGVSRERPVRDSNRRGGDSGGTRAVVRPPLVRFPPDGI